LIKFDGSHLIYSTMRKIFKLKIKIEQPDINISDIA